MFPRTYKKKFQLAIAVIVVPIMFRLLLVAETTGNWRGFFYTTLHVFLIAGATYYLLIDAGREELSSAEE